MSLIGCVKWRIIAGRGLKAQDYKGFRKCYHLDEELSNSLLVQQKRALNQIVVVEISYRVIELFTQVKAGSQRLVLEDFNYDQYFLGLLILPGQFQILSSVLTTGRPDRLWVQNWRARKEWQRLQVFNKNIKLRAACRLQEVQQLFGLYIATIVGRCAVQVAYLFVSGTGVYEHYACFSDRDRELVYGKALGAARG